MINFNLCGIGLQIQVYIYFKMQRFWQKLVQYLHFTYANV